MARQEARPPNFFTLSLARFPMLWDGENCCEKGTLIEPPLSSNLHTTPTPLRVIMAATFLGTTKGGLAKTKQR